MLQMLTRGGDRTFDRNHNCDLHLEASGSVPDNTWTLESAGSSSKRRRKLAVRSPSDGGITSSNRSMIEARSPRDHSPIAARSWAITAAEARSLDRNRNTRYRTRFIGWRNQRLAGSPRSSYDRDAIVARSSRDRGHDQAKSWRPCGKIKATIKAGSRP